MSKKIIDPERVARRIVRPFQGRIKFHRGSVGCTHGYSRCSPPAKLPTPRFSLAWNLLALSPLATLTCNHVHVYPNLLPRRLLDQGPRPCLGSRQSRRPVSLHVGHSEKQRLSSLPDQRC